MLGEGSAKTAAKTHESMRTHQLSLLLLSSALRPNGGCCGSGARHHVAAPEHGSTLYRHALVEKKSLALF